MNLLIDIGNTRTKWVLVNDGDSLPEVSVYFNRDDVILQLLEQAKCAQKIFISNVAGEAALQKMLDALVATRASVHCVKTSVELDGVHNSYEAPQRLGVDRWLALIAANQIAQTHCLVVSMGTAITMDALIKDNNARASFIGGTIMPGMRMMQDALSHHTADLSFTHGGFTQGDLQKFPKNTQDAIFSGCINSVIGAIQLQWQRLKNVAQTPPALLLSGGDADLLVK
ncbi:MAG TPA: type III pantothenate kinase, partial [Methylophilaceae bacterium]|nr:type III pantothenate kinase [Methylophilaceae bacterium]